MRWPPRSVRVRLTLWYAATLAVVLIVYAVGVYAFLQRTLLSSLDRQLADDVEAAEELLERTANGGIAWRGGSHADDDHEDRWLEVWTQSGSRLYQSVHAQRTPLASSATGMPVGSQGSVVMTSGARMRVLTRTAWIDGLQVVARVARSEEYVRHELGELFTVLAVALPFAVALAALGGYGLARRALAPVDRMRERARAITAERLSERLPIGNPNDELGRLTETFNELLARLETSFEQMRRFTADASHELRTPLTAIRSVGEVGLRERRDEKAYREIIGSMLEEVDRLTHLIDGLLILSRADAGHVRVSAEPVDLKELAEEVAAHLSVLAEERRQSIRIEAPRSVRITADRMVLRQALINLLDNAIKYSPPDATIRLSVRDDGRAAHVEIVDSGPGIPLQHRDRVFDRFYRVDAARSRELGGVGLGLSIARWAVEINGGRLEYEPAHPIGGLFRITFPREAIAQPTRTF